MSVNEIHIDAAPDDVFGVLSSARRYAEWVVGAKRIRRADDAWPQPGSKLHHTVGVGPLSISDDTKVVALDAPCRIVLEARARPVGRARVEVMVDADGSGSRVRMVEHVTGAPGPVQRFLDPAIWSRNAEALRRLRQLCEGDGEREA